MSQHYAKRLDLNVGCPSVPQTSIITVGKSFKQTVATNTRKIKVI
jgi:hypothetical protein